MEPSALVTALLSAMPALLLSAVVALVGAIVAGVGLLRGRPGPLAAAAPVAVPLVVAEVAAFVALRGLDVDPGHAVAVAVGARLVGLYLALPAAAIVAVLAAVVGARGPVRRWKEALPVLALALATAAVTLAGGVAEEDWLYPAVRAAIYALAGVALAAAHVGGDGEAGAHPDAAATAGAVFALVVAAGELSARALEHVFLLAVMGGVAPADRLAYVDLAHTDVIGPSAPWHDGALALGWVTAVVSVALEGRSGRPRAWSALAWVVFAMCLGRAASVDAEVLRAVAPALGAP